MSGFTVRKLAPPLWGVAAPYYSPKLKELARKIPGMEWIGPSRCWAGYEDAVREVVDLLNANGMKVDDSLLKAHGDRFEHQLNPSFAQSRPYQKDGINFLVAHGPSGALLADDMGLGKGHQALRAARAFKGKTLIVCPSHARGVWDREPTEGADPAEIGEVYKWWPDAAKTVYRTAGVTPETIPADAMIVVVHYEILYAWVDAIVAWGPKTVIFDEIQALQGEESKRSKAAREVREGCGVAMGLSGTPMTNRPRDLYNVISTLSPGRVGEKFFQFGLRYCDGRKEDIKKAGGVIEAHWNFNGASNTEELHRRLGCMMLRRTKEEVMKELPPMTNQVVDLDVGARAILPSHAVLTSGKGSPAMRRALDLAADRKQSQSWDLIRSHLQQGRKVVVFTWRKHVAEDCVEKCGGAAKLAHYTHGGVAPLKRSKRIDDLRKASKTGPILLAATIDSCATGLDFSFADVAVFLELTWEPHKLLQARSRLHRFGQLMPVLVQWLIARGTADELVLSGVLRKHRLIEATIGKMDEKASLSALAKVEENDVEASLKQMADAIREMQDRMNNISVGKKGRRAG